MTFDDGIMRVCSVTNVSGNGEKPVMKLTETERFYFGFDVVGINRYYTALAAKVQLSHVVNIPGWSPLDPLSVIVLEDGTQYRLSMVQPLLDDDGLRVTKLSLERITENYEFTDETENG